MDFRNLRAYQIAYEAAMAIFQVSKSFPIEERYSLTDQIRRSSRSVCANMAEAYRKRCYTKNFKSKLTDCDAENSETMVWLEFALSCDYISKNEYDNILSKTAESGKLIQYMLHHPEKLGNL